MDDDDDDDDDEWMNEQLLLRKIFIRFTFVFENDCTCCSSDSLRHRSTYVVCDSLVILNLCTFFMLKALNMGKEHPLSQNTKGFLSTTTTWTFSRLPNACSFVVNIFNGQRYPCAHSIQVHAIVNVWLNQVLTMPFKSHSTWNDEATRLYIWPRLIVTI
jgi:hypothetical protein